MKKFKTISEQLQLLHDRGLVIHDDAKAGLYLLTQNYYNIINGYASYFPRNGEQYTQGTSFDEIAHLYVFEREIKQALSQASLSMESHLKSIFAHRFAEAYPDVPYAYLNINCYDKNKTLEVISTISQLSKVISRHKNHKDSSIAHYVRNHNDVPIWVLANYLDFGELRYMLASSPTSLQNTVAKDLLNFIQVHLPPHSLTVPFSPEVMQSFIENINDVRNVCAHNNRLIGFTCRRDSKHWAPLHSQYNITKNAPRNTVFSVFISLQCFLSKSEYGTVHNTLRKEFFKLDKRMKTISSNDILSKLGFPIDWHKTVCKIQH